MRACCVRVCEFVHCRQGEQRGGASVILNDGRARHIHSTFLAHDVCIDAAHVVPKLARFFAQSKCLSSVQ